MPQRIKVKGNKVVSGVSPRAGRRLTRILLQCKRTTLDQHGKIKIVEPLMAHESAGKVAMAPSNRTMPKVKPGKIVPGKPEVGKPVHYGYGKGSVKEWNSPAKPKNGKPYR